MTDRETPYNLTATPYRPRTRAERRERRDRWAMSRRNRIVRYVGDDAGSARARDREALYRLRHTTYRPTADGGLVAIYHPFAPVYDDLADTMTPPARVGLR